MIRHGERLFGVDQRLQAVVRAAAQLVLPNDVQVIEGVRTLERQKQLYAQGRTAPGAICTWTLQSKHIGGLAVDVALLQADGSINWNDPAGFDRLAEAMFTASRQVGVRLRWGADWDQDGNPRERGETDSPHFELA
jgi:peptidoglycan L-alanyl-D-glutamate endopeptidase CwlK